ncbi:MAG: hypothetical protein ACNA8G_13615 [Gammaproteobacteria bacterium]
MHLYIHAVEASSARERGVAAADRLRSLVPAAGHLVHMPAHIYARVGRYGDAVIANQKAIQADDAYLAACRPTPGVYPLGYVPHNHHFLWFAATMSGASATALDAAKSTRERISDPELIRAPGFEAMRVWERYSLAHGVRIAEHVLRAELLRVAGDRGAAIAVLREAEVVCREELRRNPENGCSLYGLNQALLAQDDAREHRPQVVRDGLGPQRRLEVAHHVGARINQHHGRDGQARQEGQRGRHPGTYAAAPAR